MASEARLYKFSSETQEQLRKFRLSTSRVEDPQAIIYQIDKTTLEVIPANDGQVYSSLADLADSLPDNAPRFVLLSYPITVSGRASTPYVLLFYLPVTTNTELRMIYAGLKERLRVEAGVSRVIEVENEEEIEKIEDRLSGQS